MLNGGAELFSDERNDAHPDKRDVWTQAKEWRLQQREKGFVPYWWDDGASISLERLGRKEPLAVYPCRDELAGKPNPEFRLSGYSLGSSNHLAQDLGCMLELAWLLLNDSRDPLDNRLVAEVATAATNLQGCRTRHGSGGIPAVLAAVGLANRDTALLKRFPEETWESALSRKNHFQQATVEFQVDRRYATPGFADDQQYRYYSSLARSGTISEPAAWRCAFDAFTETALFDNYFDDSPRPPGINRFDLYPFSFVNGKPEHVRSQRKGPFQGPVPVGSRMGPQNMICCGWALQGLKTFPGLWERGISKSSAEKLGLKGEKAASETQLIKWLERELGGGLRTWEAIFDEYGYLPTGIGCQTAVAGTKWDAFSDTGGYAHLISAASQWVLYLEGKRDWELNRVLAGEPND